MKVAVILLAFVAAALAAGPICMPDQYTTDNVVWDPRFKNVDYTKVYVDAAQKKERVDFFDIAYGFHHVSRGFVILDYASGYEYFVEGDHCRTAKLTGSFRKQCLATNAGFVGSATLGGSLDVDHYNETVATGGKADIFLAKGKDTPVQVVFASEKVGVVFQQFWNFKAGAVNSGEFSPPATCNNTDAALADPRGKCADCQTVVDYIEDYGLKSKICEKLGWRLSTELECELIVECCGDKIVSWLTDGWSPLKICTEIDMCPDETTAMIRGKSGEKKEGEDR